ncbi:MAG: YggT family protein [Rhodocyclaceae bacterium]|nr:YggT family protein [Rhodocyclaceae bacterium]
MLARILLLIVETVAGFLTFAFLARFALQWARGSFRNPLGQFLVAVTDWAVRPARRLIPGAFGLDLPSLTLAWLTQLLAALVLILLIGGPAGALSPATLLAAALGAVIAVLRFAIWLAMAAIFVSALFSWVNPHAPLAGPVDALSRPLLRPFRRLLPPIGGVDLTPLLALLALQIAQIVLDQLQSIVMFGSRGPF